jgi:hypothetical protein
MKGKQAPSSSQNFLPYYHNNANLRMYYENTENNRPCIKGICCGNIEHKNGCIKNSSVAWK